MVVEWGDGGVEGVRVSADEAGDGECGFLADQLGCHADLFGDLVALLEGVTVLARRRWRLRSNHQPVPLVPRALTPAMAFASAEGSRALVAAPRAPVARMTMTMAAVRIMARAIKLWRRIAGSRTQPSIVSRQLAWLRFVMRGSLRTRTATSTVLGASALTPTNPVPVSQITRLF